jgi:hypothetical protein
MKLATKNGILWSPNLKPQKGCHLQQVKQWNNFVCPRKSAGICKEQNINFLLTQQASSFNFRMMKRTQSWEIASLSKFAEYVG